MDRRGARATFRKVSLKGAPYTGGGAPPGADAIVIRRLDDSRPEATFDRGGKLVCAGERVIADDGNSMMTTPAPTAPKGQKAHSTSIYDRR